MTDGRTFTLSHPLRFKLTGSAGRRERTIDRVTLRPPVGRDLLLIDQYQGKPMELRMALISALTGLTALQVKKLDAHDVRVLGEMAIDGLGVPPIAASAGDE